MPAGIVPVATSRPSEGVIGRPALEDIGGEVAEQFHISPEDGARRANNVLRGLDANNMLPGRKGYGS